MIQEQGFQETSAGLRRYTSELLDLEEVGAPLEGEISARETVDELEDGGEALDDNEVLEKTDRTSTAVANIVLNQETDDAYESSELAEQPLPDSALKPASVGENVVSDQEQEAEVDTSSRPHSSAP
ncbi:hypothetical protein BGZ70_001708 [Mortierella alpina]|uniref:Uncharacterized protein n=1 Tax=Mortierella alpina TaxID=64518 RepID=A0A9P6IVS6_MORAP|nr:hypothetical protein BGZ70_001708 [Mortierella alpina]